MVKNKVIVIGGDHYNTLGVVRSLGVVGISSYLIIITSSKNSFVAKSKYVQKTWFLEKEEDIISILRNDVTEEKDLPVIICTSDASASIIDQNYSWLNQKYLLFNSGHKEGKMANWMDKKRMAELAREVGFNVPKTWELRLNVQSNLKDLIPEDMIYPCIIKPQKSCEGSKYDFRLCYNSSDLHHMLVELKGHLDHVVLQEYLKPDYEISFPAVSLSQENVLPGLILKLKTSQDMFNLGMVVFACLKPKLEPLIDISVVDRFIKHINYLGLYSMDFFVHNDKVYFLEINLRSDGNIFYATEGGVNLPLLWVYDVVGHDTKRLKKKIDSDIYGMLEISYLKNLKKLTLTQILKDWYRTDCYSIFSWKDIKPFIYKFIYYPKG